jgi:hypothetical protein
MLQVLVWTSCTKFSHNPFTNLETETCELTCLTITHALCKESIESNKILTSAL